MNNPHNRGKNQKETRERGKPRRQSYIKQNMLDVGKGLYKELKEVATDKEEQMNITSSIFYGLKNEIKISY